MKNEIILSYLYDEPTDESAVVSSSIVQCLNADHTWPTLLVDFLKFLVSAGFIIDHKIIEKLGEKADQLLDETYNKDIKT